MPMAVTITAFKDNTFEFMMKSLSVTWYLKKAAGIESESGRTGHVTGHRIMVEQTIHVTQRHIVVHHASEDMATSTYESTIMANRPLVLQEHPSPPPREE
ncbi:hypothetical protein ACLB2K_025532 [Fragaria x ananassa]